MATPESVHSITFPVRAYECAPTGRVHPGTLLNALQETASRHATRLGVGAEALAAEHRTWVLARLRVRIERLPAWRDAIVVDTWPSGMQGIFATRDFSVRTEAGDAVARATSAWFMIDIRRRRPVRLPESVHAIERPERERALVDDFDRLPAPASYAYTGSRTVERSDLDMNGHANHVRYVDWALDALPETIARQRLREIEVHFKQETRSGDVLRIQAGPDPEDASRQLHVIRTEDDRTAAELATRWG